MVTAQKRTQNLPDRRLCNSDLHATSMVDGECAISGGIVTWRLSHALEDELRNDDEWRPML